MLERSSWTDMRLFWRPLSTANICVCRASRVFPWIATTSWHHRSKNSKWTEFTIYSTKDVVLSGDTDSTLSDQFGLVETKCENQSASTQLLLHSIVDFLHSIVGCLTCNIDCKINRNIDETVIDWVNHQAFGGRSCKVLPVGARMKVGLVYKFNSCYACYRPGSRVLFQHH